LSTDAKALIRATVQGTIWGYVSRYSAKLFVFISTIFLARLLSKDDFGVAAYAIVTINFVEFLQGLGLQQALIYYPKDEKQNYTAFWLGLGSGLVLFLVSFFVISPLVGIFYNDVRAVPVTQALSFYFILVSLDIVQVATLSKRLAFARRSIPAIGNSLFKGIISISLALLGYGAWSLIYGQLAGTLVEVLLFWYISKWRPSFQFEKKYVRPLLSYGLNIFSISAMSNLLANVDYFLIGRYMGAETLGVYTLAFRLPMLLIKQLSGVLGDVIFPVFTKIKDDVSVLKRSFLTSLEYVNLLTVPVGLGLAVVAKWVILVFFGEKWIDAVPVMVAISILSVLRAMVYNIGDAYKAIGRPDLVTKINFWQTLITVPLLWWVVTQVQTLTAVAWIQVAVVFVFAIVKLVIAINILKIKYLRVFKALLPSLLSGSIMALVVYGVVQLNLELLPIYMLSLSVVVGALVYMGVLLTFYREGTIKAFTRIKSGVIGK